MRNVFVDQSPMSILTICKPFCTSQTHHFSTRLLSYTSHRSVSFLFAPSSAAKNILLIKPEKYYVALRREMSVFTHPRKILNGWEFARERLESNKSIEMFLYPFLLLSRSIFVRFEIEWWDLMFAREFNALAFDAIQSVSLLHNYADLK